MCRIGERYDFQYAIAATGNEGELSPWIVDHRIRSGPDGNRGDFFSAIGLHDFGQTVPARGDQELRIGSIGKSGRPLATRELVGPGDSLRFGVDDRDFGGGFDIVEYLAC